MPMPNAGVVRCSACSKPDSTGTPLGPLVSASAGASTAPSQPDVGASFASSQNVRCSLRLWRCESGRPAALPVPGPVAWPASDAARCQSRPMKVYSLAPRDRRKHHRPSPAVDWTGNPRGIVAVGARFATYEDRLGPVYGVPCWGRSPFRHGESLVSQRSSVAPLRPRAVPRARYRSAVSTVNPFTHATLEAVRP